ncbi:DUF4193 domain-containing protein [Arthrobacter sp.]|uniref:DUF4193 domain-containing protein n=1 Tax=Arthrobacter sp. TaxID=1667 RepID=UPI001EC036EB|nr:DUF4193 domain-containing protein [Micrococcaceae bacterium RIT 802]
MAQDYDEARPDVAERSEETLKRVKEMDAPSARTVTEELDEGEALDGPELPGAIVDDELVVRVLPQAADEFTCGSCFLVRHRSQLAREKDGVKYCRDCEA